MLIIYNRLILTVSFVSIWTVNEVGSNFRTLNFEYESINNKLK